MGSLNLDGSLGVVEWGLPDGGSVVVRWWFGGSWRGGSLVAL